MSVILHFIIIVGLLRGKISTRAQKCYSEILTISQPSVGHARGKIGCFVFPFFLFFFNFFLSFFQPSPSVYRISDFLISLNFSPPFYHRAREQRYRKRFFQSSQKPSLSDPISIYHERTFTRYYALSFLTSRKIPTSVERSIDKTTNFYARYSLIFIGIGNLVKRIIYYLLFSFSIVIN